MGTPTMDEALERVKQWTLADILPKLKQPFLIVHGAEDKTIPIEDARKAFFAAGSVDKELRIAEPQLRLACRRPATKHHRGGAGTRRRGEVQFLR